MESNVSRQAPRRIGTECRLRLAARLRAACIRKGWDLSELARRAGVSRTTLYHLERGATRRPHAATLSRLAAALDIPPERLSMPKPDHVSECDSREAAGPPCDSVLKDETGTAACRFDRETNPVVAEVASEEPGLFRGWGPEDWDELYSTFGTGGALTREGVHEAAARRNRNRDLLQKVQVVLETHLADVAAGMIDALYQQVRVPPAGEPPTDGLVGSPPRLSGMFRRGDQD